MQSIVIALNVRAKSSVDVEIRGLWFTRYLYAKRIYRGIDATKKDAIYTKFKLEAKNPCKAAWNIINSHQKTPVRMACMSSPDEINSYFIEVVGKICLLYLCL